MTYFGCFFLLYLFQGLIIYLIGSRVFFFCLFFAWDWFSPRCVVKYDMFQWLNVSVNLFYAWTSKSLSVVLRRESHTIALTSSWLWEVSMLALYGTWVLYLPLSRALIPILAHTGNQIHILDYCIFLYINWRGEGIRGPSNFFIRGLYLRL